MSQTALDFSTYITNRTRDFTGRVWVFAQIDQWLADPDAPHCFILTGEPGIGKTAIAARLTQFSTGEVSPPAGYDHVGSGFLSAFHFCSARSGGSISPDSFTRSLSAQLAERYLTFAQALVGDMQIHVELHVEENLGTIIGAQITEYYADNIQLLFDKLVRQPLQALCSDGGQSGSLVILVDALDESLGLGRESIVRLLAACGDLPSQVRLLLTSRPVDGVLGPFRSLEPFILYAESEENRSDVHSYIHHRFQKPELQARVGDEAQMKAVASSLTSRSAGNFLVISRVLDGIEQGELDPADPEALPAELSDLYAHFLDRLVQGDKQTWRQLYRPILGCLSTAQEPVDTVLLKEWTGLSRQQVGDALLDLRELLDPALAGGCRLYHQSVVDFLTGDEAGPYYLDEAESHHTIARSYLDRFAGEGGAWADCDEYGLRYLPTHLAAAGIGESLREILLDFAWMWAKVKYHRQRRWLEMTHLEGATIQLLTTRSPVGTDKARWSTQASNNSNQQLA